MVEQIKILGIPIHAHTYATWLDQIDKWVRDSQRLHHICTVNPEFFVIASKNEPFYRVLQGADACIADGIGVVLAARLLGTPLPARVTGTDGVQFIAERAAVSGWRLFLLGAAPGVAEQTADILTDCYPTLQIVGTYAGSPHPHEADDIIGRINASQADILLVAYGAPQQDLWIDQHRAHLAVKVAMGVGGAYDFIAGIVPRAPHWMQRLGLEWLFRLIRQPWRWRRMLRLPIFMALVIVHARRPLYPPLP